MKNRYLQLLSLVLAGFLVWPAQAQTMRTETSGSSLAGFGGAVVAGTDDVFVSSARSGGSPGVIYHYSRSTGAWTEASRYSAANGEAGDNFGRAMALNGDMLAVGATGFGGNLGAAYVFQRDAQGMWSQVAHLQPEGMMEDANLGRAVGIAGDFVFAAAAGYNEQAGGVFAFKKDGDAWPQHSIIAPAEGAAGDLFGLSVAAAGDWLAVGTPVKEEGRGATYVFKHDAATDAWVEHAKLEVEGLEQNAQYGAALALMGNYLLVGAPGVDGFTGKVFMFQYDSEADEWNELPSLVPFDSSRRLGFGASIAVADNTVLVGAQGADRFSGVVYAFSADMSAQRWTSVTKIQGMETASGHGFGSAIGASGSVFAVGAPGADNGEGVATIFERGENGWEEQTTVFAEVVGMAAITGEKVDCSDGSAEMFGCSKVDLVSFVPVKNLTTQRSATLNDVWGWTDSETGKEWALVGRTDGTSFVDMSNPLNPVFVGELPKTATSPASTWRDVKVYQDHAYIVADGAAAHGMQVFDLRQLRDVKPEDMPVTFEQTALYTDIASAHNIVINEDTGFAYAVGSSSGGETCGGGLHMINIQEPANPTFAGCFADPTTGRASTGYSHDAQCLTYRGPDTEHQGKEICFGANETALSIADVTDKANPVALSRAPYPNVAYSHQGWVSEDQRYFYMNDELDESSGNVPRTRTLIWDIQDLDDPQLMKEYLLSTEAIDHNLYIKGNFMYQANYLSGLRILDITDPLNPVEWGHFDTTPNEDGISFGGAWSSYPYFDSGVVIVTSMNEGLFLVRQREIDI